MALQNLLLSTLLCLGATAGVAAQNAELTVIHGIPGLPAPVEIFANNNKLFSFDFGQSRGPLSLPAGSYNIEIKLNGATVLSANPMLAAGVSYSAVAHLKVGSGNQLSLFANDQSAIAPGQGRLTVRHLADAPPVDVGLSQNNARVATFMNLSNPNEVSADVAAGSYSASLFPAGQPQAVFGPVALHLTQQNQYIVYAIGSLSGGTFGLFVQRDPAPELMISLSGQACGGSIGASTTTPNFDEPFDVTLSGAAANAMAILWIGDSNTHAGNSALPLDLNAFGAPGCSLYQNALVAIPLMTDGSGGAALQLSVPTELGIILPDTFHQYSFQSSSNALGLEFTQLATLRAN